MKRFPFFAKVPAPTLRKIRRLAKRDGKRQWQLLEAWARKAK